MLSFLMKISKINILICLPVSAFAVSPPSECPMHQAQPVKGTNDL